MKSLRNSRKWQNIAFFILPSILALIAYCLLVVLYWQKIYDVPKTVGLYCVYIVGVCILGASTIVDNYKCKNIGKTVCSAALLFLYLAVSVVVIILFAQLVGILREIDMLNQQLSSVAEDSHLYYELEHNLLQLKYQSADYAIAYRILSLISVIFMYSINFCFTKEKHADDAPKQNSIVV